MYMQVLQVAMNRTYKHYKILIRVIRANYPQIPRVNIFTKNRVTLGDNKLFLPSPKKSELRTVQARYEYARRAVIDNVLKRTTNSLAADLRRRSVRLLFSGNPSHFFALVGTSLATENGVISKEIEFEGICWEIRESIYRMRNNLFAVENYEFEENFSLDSLELGSVIAKGSNAVVYEAREKSKTGKLTKDTENKEYPLAVKMMFNYDAESNAIAILRSMYREMVPLQNVDNMKKTNFWESEMANRIQHLPPHVNIVRMYKSFIDYVPDLPNAKELYPDALPYRLNPEGCGRNMSLFLVMKKYDTNLKQFLEDNVVSIRDGILLLTQLLEAITHINKHEIAHRDLKSDNILLDMSDGKDNCPLLVVTDFGCCLSDRYYGLRMPYQTADMIKGGNPALMAPEVMKTQSGLFATIDYSKADVWTAGSIAYEIFTGKNPFYFYRNKKREDVLYNVTYTEDMLPELPKEVPSVIRRLIYCLLVRNPAQRLDAESAATVCQLYLWAPNSWLHADKLPSSSEILQWLLSLTTKVLYEGPVLFEKSEKKRTSFTEYQLIATFLQRAKINIVRKALYWICEL